MNTNGVIQNKKKQETEVLAKKKYLDFKRSRTSALKSSGIKQAAQFMYMAERFEALLSELGIGYGDEMYERIAADFFPGWDFSNDPILKKNTYTYKISHVMENTKRQLEE